MHNFSIFCFGFVRLRRWLPNLFELCMNKNEVTFVLIPCCVLCLSWMYSFIRSAECNICDICVTKKYLARVPYLPLIIYIYHRPKHNVLKHPVGLVSIVHSKSPWIPASNGSWLSPESCPEQENPAYPSHKRISTEVPTAASTRLHRVIFKRPTFWTLDRVTWISAQSVFVNESVFEALEIWYVFSGSLKYEGVSKTQPCRVRSVSILYFVLLTVYAYPLFSLNLN
jgi:hypothetical protein